MAVSQHVRTLIRFSDFQAKLLKQQDQWLAAHGVSYKEFLIMYYLDESPTGNLKRIDLAEQVGLSASGVTRLLNPMEKIGLITKEEGARDARVSLVRLTDTGETLYQQAVESFNQRTKDFFKSVDESHRLALGELSKLRI